MKLKQRIQIFFGVAGISAFTAILRDNNAMTGLFIVVATVMPAIALLDFSLEAKKKGFVIEEED